MPPTPPKDTRPTLFFDIDNTLYPSTTRIQPMMSALISTYFSNHLSLPPPAAHRLQKQYYRDYGLALAGLVQHHQIDPLAYNAEVDDMLPLESVLERDEGLRRLLGGVDRGGVRLWLFTNAYVRHAERVVRLLGVEGFFEGVTFCDYAAVPLVAKPEVGMFEKAEREAGGGKGRFYFVDDSLVNVRRARERGWEAVLKLEEGDEVPEGWEGGCVWRLEELRGLWPQFFKDEGEGAGGGEGGKGEGGEVGRKGVL